MKPFTIPNQADLQQEVEGLQSAVAKLELDLRAKGIRCPEIGKANNPGDIFEERDLLAKRLVTLKALSQYPPSPANLPKPEASAPAPQQSAGSGKTTAPTLTAQQKAELDRATGYTKEIIAARLGVKLPTQERPLTLTEKCRAARGCNGSSNIK